MRNSKGAIIYYLFFASQQKVADNIIDDIFNKYQQLGNQVMALSSSIEWTESTWNPLTGCTKVSPGCANCYAERMALRLRAMGNPNYANGFAITMHEDALELPLKWRKPQTIFVNSMSDLFHEDVPEEFIFRVFDIMRHADWHCFQILTKRSERVMNISPQLPWMPHIWMGVSVEDQRHTFQH